MSGVVKYNTNHTFLCFAPTKNDARRIKDFRSTIPGTSLHKILAKVEANKQMHLPGDTIPLARGDFSTIVDVVQIGWKNRTRWRLN